MVFFTELGAPTGEGQADWDIEAFLDGLKTRGDLHSLRAEARLAAVQKKSLLPSTDASLGPALTVQISDPQPESSDQPSTSADPVPDSPQPTAQVVLTSSNDDTSASEAEDWDRWTSTDGASTTTCTESEWGSERDLEGQAAQTKPAVTTTRWGFQRLVGGSSATSGMKGKTGGLSDSCDSLPYIDGDGPTTAEMNGDSADSRSVDEGMIENSELDDFLSELEQNETTSAADDKGWKLVMHKNTKAMQCCSWLRDSGPRGSTEYRGRMVVQGISAETARDFFLDEQHRAEWDENRLVSQQLEEWDENGCTAIRWVRRLPFFLKNREYVVSRRVWNLDYRTFYCISRHTPHPSAPVRPDFVRVSSFHSSWRIRPVRAGCAEGTPVSNPSDDNLSAPQAVEIVTHHEEESGLQKDLARMGVAHGMWSHMLKMEQELHAYAASGKNAKHLLPVFLIQADAKLGLLGLPRPLEKHQQLQLELLTAGQDRLALKDMDDSSDSSDSETSLSPISPPLTVHPGDMLQSPLCLPAQC